ncbi:hypothetical protein L2E82_25257 [Cichorium intybus]|uniref:Uncharacterized protein n=1 Tax=Cichorium intybus TaxID=13427 RepID=A0ACB9E353_CICIN|nr:hypothetical protein L2E82_25257 [Cichorium intybus]
MMAFQVNLVRSTNEGAGLEWMDKEGKTPLILASMNPQLYDVTKTLIELDANVNAYHPEALTPSMVSRERSGFTLNIIDTPGIVEGYVNEQSLDIIKSNSFGKEVWRRAIVVLTHAQLSPPGCLTFDEFLAERSESLLKVVYYGASFTKEDIQKPYVVEESDEEPPQEEEDGIVESDINLEGVGIFHHILLKYSLFPQFGCDRTEKVAGRVTQSKVDRAVSKGSSPNYVKEEKVFGTKGRFISSNSVTRAGPYASRNLATEPLESSSPEENGPTLHLAFNRQTNRYAIVDVSNPHEESNLSSKLNMLRPHFYEMMLSQVETLENWIVETKLSTMRPNTMNNYGVVLDDFGRLHSPYFKM